MMNDSYQEVVQNLYQTLINAWNKRDAKGMAELFTEDGIQIGFDGSKLIGNEEIYSHLKSIFANYPTSSFVIKVREIRRLGFDTALFSCYLRNDSSWKE